MFGEGYAQEMKLELNLTRFSPQGLSLRFPLVMLRHLTKQGTQILVSFSNRMEVLTVAILSLSHMNMILVLMRINYA